jgi:hypothetical protein
VSLELPGWVADGFNLIGLPWPGIDEDQLREWAQDLRKYATEADALSSRSKSAVAAIAAGDESSFTRTLAAQWSHYHDVISDARGPMEVFAGALDVAADAVVAQKVVVIGAAVALAGEVIATQGEALFTFGLAEAEVPAEVAAARLIVRGALQVLEGELIGALVGKAAAIAGDALGGAVGKLVSGGGQVLSETVVLKADFDALHTVASGLKVQSTQVEQVSGVSWRRATSRPLETGGPGGGWREVAQAVEQAVFRVLTAAFKGSRPRLVHSGRGHRPVPAQGRHRSAAHRYRPRPSSRASGWCYAQRRHGGSRRTSARRRFCGTRPDRRHDQAC